MTQLSTYIDEAHEVKIRRSCWETRTQTTLREALERVYREGLCEFTPEGGYVRVCGLPMQAEAPTPEAHAAARLILCEMMRGTGFEDELADPDYDEALETITLCFQMSDFDDARIMLHAIDDIEHAYVRAGDITWAR